MFCRINISFAAESKYKYCRYVQWIGLLSIRVFQDTRQSIHKLYNSDAVNSEVESGKQGQDLHSFECGQTVANKRRSRQQQHM